MRRQLCCDCVFAGERVSAPLAALGSRRHEAVKDSPMASWRGHLTFSTGLGITYGGASWWFLNVDPALAGVAGVLTALGGLLPDLDSDSGVPVREMFNLAATLLPLLELRRLASMGLSA